MTGHPRPSRKPLPLRERPRDLKIVLWSLAVIIVLLVVLYMLGDKVALPG